MLNTKPENSTNRYKGYHPLFIVVVILLFHILFFFKYQDALLEQITLRDFDGYWHLLRTKDLYNFGNTYVSLLSRSNAPYGESLHWTSSFDLLLYAGAYIGSYFVDFNVALLCWSIILNPILHVLSFVFLYWCLRDIFGDLRASIFGVIYPFQLYLNGIFDMGVPDHHGAQIFFFSLFIAFAVKSIMIDDWKVFAMFGIVGGLSLWFGIESIFIVLISIIFFCFLWILEGKSYLNKNILFSFMVLLISFLTILFDVKSDELLAVVYDRISIVHILLFFSTSFFWIFVALVSKMTNFMENINIRIIASVFGAIGCFLLMKEAFPGFLENPLSEANSLIKMIYLNHTNEFTGLFSVNNIHPKVAYAYWILTLPAVPFGIYMVWHNRDKERKFWLYVTIITTGYIILSALIFRTITYAMLCSIIPISYAISYVYIFINERYDRSYFRFFRTAFMLLCCLSFLLPAILLNPKQPEYLLHDKKFLSQICQYLDEDPFFEKKPKRILTSIYMGPLLLYKTKHEVIGTPSHRNVSGILDTYYVMNAKKAEDAHVIIRRRGIDVLLIGKPQYGIGDFFIDNNNIGKSGYIFHHQLWKGKIPTWLQPYPIPKSFDGKIKIFKVSG